MKSTFLIFIFCLALPLISLHAQNITYSGTISEAASNETLIGVSIAIPQLKTGTTSNEYGFFSITLPKGTYTIVYSAIGFETRKKELQLTVDVQENIQLVEKREELDEVVLTNSDEKTLQIRKAQMSVQTLSTATIKKIPVVLGEADIIKSILLLPGVSNAGEGASGFNVRGGSADQNLILLDEATIFNSSHLFGFFSVFNPDAIKDVKLYKGGIPARYGGRVSSVLEMFQKEGNSKFFKANGGIGLVASRLLLEGPIQKDKSAFLIGGRGSYAHLFLPLANIDNAAYFYDLNTKLNYKINDKNSVFLSGYFGRDVFNLSDSFVNTYGNAIGNFRWNHLFNNKLFSNLSLIYSDYYYGLELDFVGFKWNSGIQNLNLKYDLKHYATDKLQINYGVHGIHHTFNPGKIEPNSADSGIITDQLTKKYAKEYAAYSSVDLDITKNLSIAAGLRWSTFIRSGQDELFVYDNNMPLLFNRTQGIYEEATPSGTIISNKKERLKTYGNIEPRFSFSYTLNDANALKGSITKTTQYLHLLSNTSSPTPLDVWTPSGPFIKPQIQHQYALGYHKVIKEGKYTLETETYIKQIQNRIDYVDGANLIANDAIETVILNGEARAYGLELLFRKNQGNLQGWIAYTLSKSEQRTPGRTNIEPGINNGNWYNTPYDKPHDLSIFASYDLNQKWSFSSNLIYQTGQPTNYPVGQFMFQGLSVPFYGLRNTERLPDYHRMDISATLTPQKNEVRKIKGEWVFSIYNVYNRRNAASINFTRNVDTRSNEAVRTSIFGMVPAITYNFKF